jgi:hypothetical protein
MFSRTSFILLFIIGVTLFITDVYSESDDADDSLEAPDQIYKRHWLENLQSSQLFKRNAQTFPVDKKTKKKIQRIIAAWKLDELRNNLPIGSLYQGVLSEDSSSRIDNQSPITKDGMRYYNVQVQLGTRTYSTIFIPSGQKIGQRQIRNAFVKSLDSGKSWIFKKTTSKAQPWKLQADS